MVIAAKYPGKCNRCNGSICRGDRIEWSKGGGAAHLTCAGVDPATAAAPPDDKAERRRRGLCPTCGGWMPRGYSAKGYQCDGCADAAEGIGWGA